MYAIRIDVLTDEKITNDGAIILTEAELRAARELLHRLAGGSTANERRALNMLRDLLASAPAQT